VSLRGAFQRRSNLKQSIRSLRKRGTRDDDLFYFCHFELSFIFVTSSEVEMFDDKGVIVLDFARTDIF
jgi:hypothetical protein